MTVAIIKTIGMALGLAIWGSVSLCTGWLTGKYGLLGTPKDDTITRPTLNLIGLIIVIIAIVLFAMVKPNNENNNNNNNMDGDGYESMVKTKTMVFNENYNHKPSSPAVFNKRQEQLSHINDPVKEMDYKIEMEMIESWVDKLSPKQKQIAGVLIASFAGFCYGISFCPIQYLMSQNSNNDEFGQDLEDYTFEHYCGIVTAGVLYFTLYIIYTKNKPSINTSGIAPSILSGFLWGFGQIAFFVATDKENLGTQTAFPVIVTVPQIVASSWGVFYFKEVSGFKEISKLLIALIVLFTGIGFMVIAKY